MQIKKDERKSVTRLQERKKEMSWRFHERPLGVRLRKRHMDENLEIRAHQKPIIETLRFTFKDDKSK